MNSDPAASGLRVLILGGTGYIGPHFVRAALARGHRVAVFNRGKDSSHLPAGVERLIGDRRSDLSTLTGRDWDAVADLAVFVPDWVRQLGAAIGNRVAHYTLISTHFVYQPAKNRALTEGMPTRKFNGDPYVVTKPSGLDDYGSLKALCEREASLQFPNRTLALRPGYIVGPGDHQPYLSYVPLRLEKGSAMLLAGSPMREAQFVDVRDLAQFWVQSIESGRSGVYNMAGPALTLTVGDLVQAAAEVTGVQADPVWVDAEWIDTVDDWYWQYPLFWSPKSFAAWATPTDSRKAVREGATFRAVVDSIADAFHDAKERSPERDGTLQLLARGGRAAAYVPWHDYLARERAVLSDWKGR